MSKRGAVEWGIVIALWWRATYNAIHRPPSVDLTLGQLVAILFSFLILDPLLIGDFYNEAFTNNFGPDAHQPAPIILLLVVFFFLNRRTFRAIKGGRLPYKYTRHIARELATEENC